MSNSLFFDCFGQEVEGHACEYCGQAKPVKLWSGIENCRNTYNVLMEQIEHPTQQGLKVWCCVDCSNDMKNKLEGKDT